MPKASFKQKIIDYTERRNIRTLNVFLRIQKEIGSRKRLQYYALIVVMLLVGITESISTAWIAIYASVLADPESMLANPRIHQIQDFLGITIPDDPAIILVAGSVVMAVLIIVKNAFRAVARFLNAYYSESVISTLGARIIFRYLYRPYSWFLSQDQSELIQTVQWRQKIRLFLVQVLNALSDIIIVVSLFITLLLFNAKVTTPIILTVTILASLVFRFAKRRIDDNAMKMKELNMSIFSDVKTLIGGYKSIRIAGIENFFHKKTRNSLRDRIKLAAQQGFWMGAPMLALESVGFLMLALSVIIMTIIMKSSSSDTLALMALIGVTAWRVLPALNRFLKTQSSIRQHLPFIEGFFDSLHDDSDKEIRKPKKKKKTEHSPFEKIEGIEFRQVSFQYAGTSEKVLDNISLRVDGSEKIGIVGLSGSGKTTMVDLLTGLLQPISGEILINGISQHDVGEAGWKSILNYMPQRVHLIRGSLLDNVVFGSSKNGPDPQRVVESCLKAELSALMDDDRSVLTRDEVFDDGNNLSGGQVQRVGVARMFYKDSGIWIIDEGTASLDKVTERKVLENIFENEDRTVFFITHRLESLRYCNRILVLENGRIKYFDKPEVIIPRFSGQEEYFIDDDGED